MTRTKSPLLLLSIFLLIFLQKTFAQAQQPAPEAHLRKAVKSLSDKNFELWKSLFPDRKETVEIYTCAPETEWETPAGDAYLRHLEEDLAYIKVQRFYTRSFLRALQSGREVHSSNMEPVGSYHWAEMQIEQFRFDKLPKETKSCNVSERSGYIVLKNKKDNKQYIVRFTDVLAFRQNLWGIELHDLEELKEPLDEYLKVATMDGVTAAIDEVAAIDTVAAVPAYAPTVAETESEYTGTVGARKISIYWTDIETGDGSRTEVAYASAPTYTYFSTEDLQNHNFILTEPDAAAFWHIRRIKNSITGIRVLPDGSVGEKVVLKIKSSGKPVHKN